MNTIKRATYLLITIYLLAWQYGQAQNTTAHLPMVVSVFNNATLLPGGGKLGVFGIPVHPGISIGTEFTYNDDPDDQLYQTAKLGYHYHHYVQHSVQLYSEFGYRHYFKWPIDISPRIGVGYLHSFPNAQIYELDSEGVYQRTGQWGRPQLMASMALEVGYTLMENTNGPLRAFLAYQFYLQMPFVQEYVPLMPNTALHLGVSLPFWDLKNK